MSTRQLSRYAAVSGVTALLCFTAGCGSDVAAPVPQVRPVRFTVVSTTSGAGANTYTADIRSRQEADLSFQVGGKLISRSVDIGASVRKGAVLAQLDPVDQRVGVEAARSNLNAARADLDRMRSDEARYRDLLERGLTTRTAHLAQQTAVKTAQSRVDQVAADLHMNEQRLAYTTLRAEEDGVVTRVLAETGSVVSAGQRIVSIARPSELEAVFDVPDSRIDAVRSVKDVQVALLTNPDATFPARVREISPSADPVTRTYQVKTAIPNPPATLRLGMTVTVTLAQQSNDLAIALPSTALFQKDRAPAVWVIRQDQTLELRPVEIVRYDADRILVAAGLKPQERVVTAGVHRLAAGDKVRLLEGVQR